MMSIEQTEKYFHTTPKGNVTILGSRSDICHELAKRFDADDWQVTGWKRDEKLPLVPWDLLICGIGVLDPIGKFFETDADEWEQNIDSNVLLPLRLLRRLWKHRKPNASVCFFSGAGVSRFAQTYSGYAASKLMLFKMTELLDDEEPDTKFFILGPGMVRTKIQRQTVLAGPRAANIERVMQFMDKGDPQHGTGTSHDKIYKCVRWCMNQPKNVIGGRNVYIPSDRWDETDFLPQSLAEHNALFKLRRLGDGKF